MTKHSASSQTIPQNQPGDETIAAISTPFGESGIGIVRMSGASSLAILKLIFRPKRDSKEGFNPVSHRLVYGDIVDPCTGRVVDEVLAVYMKAPKTYTREDIVEIHCHGGYLVLKRVLELVVRYGARLAEPGEFTKRAYLSGRIDLTRAEAVIDIVKAKTDLALEIANRQLRGKLYEELSAVRDRILELQALVEAHIDFPEDVDLFPVEAAVSSLDEIGKKIESWVESFEEGRMFQQGVSCVIIGKTNVGKSSLLNALLREERAIVTPIAGTTRDIIEDMVNIREIPVRLIDTAGFRDPEDIVEAEGVRRTREKVANADLVLFVLDGSRPLDTYDTEIMLEVKTKRKILVLNKVDLPLIVRTEDLKERFPEEKIVAVSAQRGDGIAALNCAIYDTLVSEGGRRRIEEGEVIVSNVRHKYALEMTREDLRRACRGIEEGRGLELVAFDLRRAAEHLGEVLGETTSEDILAMIFERFCIGK